VCQLELLGLETSEAERPKPANKCLKLELLSMECVHLLLPILKSRSHLLEQVTEPLALRKDLIDVLIAPFVTFLDLGALSLILALFD
jgi:hypothetical protein